MGSVRLDNAGKPHSRGLRTLAFRLNTFDQLLHFLFVFFGSEDELDSHAIARVHALHGSIDSQFNVVRAHYQLQFGPRGKRLSGLDVTAAGTDIGQSAASCDGPIRPVNFHSHATWM